MPEHDAANCSSCGEPTADHYNGMSDLAACRGVRIKRLEAEVERLRSSVRTHLSERMAEPYQTHHVSAW